MKNPADPLGAWPKPKASVLLSDPLQKLLAKIWRDGDVWRSNPHLAKLLSDMMQQVTQTSTPMPPESWADAARLCVEWTTGENKGKASSQGGFQQALLMTRQLGSIRANIMQHWFRLLKTCPLTDLKYRCRTLLANVQPEQAEYFLYRMNHELSRVNSNQCKKDQKHRRKWYTTTAPHGYQDDSHAGKSTKLPDTNGGQQNNEQMVEWKLEAIVEERFSEITGETMFRCRWVGFSSEDDTWEYIGADHIEMIRWRKKNPVPEPMITEPPAKKPKTTAGSKKTKPITEPLSAKIRKKPTTPAAATKLPTFPAPPGNPDCRNQDQAALVKGSVIWVEYFRKADSDEMQWFAAKIILVSSAPLKGAKVVRVLFEDGQKETLNLRGLPNAYKLEQTDSSKYCQFNWSSGSI